MLKSPVQPWGKVEARCQQSSMISIWLNSKISRLSQIIVTFSGKEAERKKKQNREFPFFIVLPLANCRFGDNFPSHTLWSKLVRRSQSLMAITQADSSHGLVAVQRRVDAVFISLVPAYELTRPHTCTHMHAHTHAHHMHKRTCT